MNAPSKRGPVASPLASSTGARDPRGGAVIWLVTQMTLYPCPFCFFIPFPVLPGSPYSHTQTLAVAADRGRGGLV